ncbi:hypothetical protein D3C72_1969910 [compost metagenome]
MGIEQRDDDDDPQVIHDGQGQQENLQAGRHPFAKQRHHPEGEGDIGRSRDGPTGPGDFVLVVEEGIDERRGQHAAYGGDGREGGLHPG